MQKAHNNYHTINYLATLQEEGDKGVLKDRILAGTIAGMIAAGLKGVPNVIFWKMGIVKHLYFHLGAASLITQKDVDTPIGLILGIVVDIITGGTLGLLIMYLLKFTGRDFWWYKGLIVGNVIWLFGLGLAINLGASRIVPVDPVFRLASLIEHQIFGLATAYLIIKWYPQTGNEPNKPEKNVKVSFREKYFPVPARKLQNNKIRLVKKKIER